MFVELKFARPGKGITTFQERLVADTPDTKVLLLEQHASGPIHHNDQLILGKNAPIVWFVFPGKWYSVGRFHTTENEFTGWYTNLCTPFTMRGGQWSTTDLFLDFWQPAQGEGVWLDEHELEDAVLKELLNASQQDSVQRERSEISDAYAAGSWPPSVATDITFESVRNALLSPAADNFSM